MHVRVRVGLCVNIGAYIIYMGRRAFLWVRVWMRKLLWSRACVGEYVCGFVYESLNARMFVGSCVYRRACSWVRV